MMLTWRFSALEQHVGAMQHEHEFDDFPRLGHESLHQRY